MKFNIYTSIICLILALSKASGSYAQCPVALQREKVAPTTTLGDFNGTAPPANIAITSITPSTPTTGSPTALGWTGAGGANPAGGPISASPGPNTVGADNASTVFLQEDLIQTLTRPVTDANLAGVGAVITLVIAPNDGFPVANSVGATFEVLYNGVVYGWISTQNGQTSANGTTVVGQNGATASVFTIPLNTSSTVSFTLPGSIPNSGNFQLRYTSGGSVANPLYPGGVPSDDYNVFSASFKSCPAIISGNVFNDNNAGTPDGTAIGGPGSASGQLYVSLVDALGNVVATMPVAADGSYSFPVYTSGAYTTQLSTIQGTVGQPAPAPSLPSGWSEVSEIDGSLNQSIGVTVVNANTNTNLTGYNFGINQPPIATDDNLSNQIPGNAAIIPNILGNDSDANGGTLSPDNISLVAPAGATGITTDAQGDVTGFTVPGEGTWTLNSSTGEITFTPLPGFTLDPTPIAYTVIDAAGLESNVATLIVNYTQVVLSDYGDLPYSGAAVNYPKVKASFTDGDNNHVPDDAGAVWLGTLIDAEADGFTNPASPADYAKGDDLSGVADEDGLVINGVMSPGTVTWTITANSNQPNTVHYGMWVDWGSPIAGPDGTFNDFYSGTITTASPASQTVSVTVPASFLNGSLVNVRLMASPTALDPASGFSTNLANGEVEDYQFAYQQAMPVRLVSFEAKASEHNAELHWKATDQENFDRYEVERSVDGKNFQKVAEIASNNRIAGDYAYADEGAASNGAQLYYRLKMVDTDDSFAYSTLRSVRFGVTGAGSVYPNPVKDKLTVKVTDRKLVKSVRIYNLSGLQVYSSGPVVSGELDVSGLGAGAHVLRVAYLDGTEQTYRFVHIR